MIFPLVVKIYLFVFVDSVLMISRSITHGSIKFRLVAVLFLLGLLFFSAIGTVTAATPKTGLLKPSPVLSTESSSLDLENPSFQSAYKEANPAYMNQDVRYDLLRKELETRGIELNSKVVSPYLLDLQGKEIQPNNDGSIDLIFSFEGNTKLTDYRTLLENYNFEILNAIPKLDAFVLRGDINVFNSFLLTNARGIGLEYISPRTEYQITDLETHNNFGLNSIPNDPRWSEQYGPQTIRANEAWGQITNAPSDPVIIGVIDTGIDYNHPDLDSIYLTGGRDWVNNDDDPMDDNNHGTHVAGIIAAEINNSLGIAGVAGFGPSYVRFMAEKVFTAWGGGSDDQIAQGIIHAVDFGIDIMSNSWGGGPSDLIEEAMEYARDNGVIIIAAAGNGYGQDADMNYPAALPYVISVSSTDRNDQLSFFSSYGYTVDVAAPGSDVLSSIIGGDYAEFSGTSMATPHVSATAALMLLKQPDLSPFEVRTLLHDTSVDLGEPGFDVKFGYGRIDALNATVASERPNIDLRATIYVPQHPVITNSIIDVTIGLFNFGTTSQDLSYVVKRDGKVLDSGTYTNFPGASEIQLQQQLFVVDPKDVTLQVYITPVTGETNIDNNNVTQVLSFGQQSYQLQVKDFVWDDAKNGGRDLGLQGDDAAIEVPLPFSFEYYEGFNFETAFVSTNGYVSFINPQPTFFYPSIFPDDFNPFVIAPLWTDLVLMDFSGNTSSEGPSLWIKERSDSVILQWDNAHLFFDMSANLSFQLVLYMNGDIEFNYLDVGTEFTTVGLNKGLRTNDFTQFWSPLQGPFSATNLSLSFSRNVVKVQNDMGVSIVSVPEMGLPSDNYTIQFAVVNYGLSDATDVSYDLTLNSTSVMAGTTNVDAGFGNVFEYEWMPTAEGLYRFNLSISPYLNETNLGNNAIVFDVEIVSSNLNIPFNANMDYFFNLGLFGMEDEWPLLTMYIEQSDTDPTVARFWLSYSDLKTGNLLTEFFLEFNILTFEIIDSFGNDRLPFALPSFADIGYENGFGRVVERTTFNFQGQTRDAFRLEGFYGNEVFYDAATGAMLSDIEPVWNGTTEITATVDMFYAPQVITPPTTNQLVKVFAPDGPLGGETEVYTYVRNVGQNSVSGTTLSLTMDNIDQGSVSINALSPGSSQVDVWNLPTDEGLHEVTASLSGATGETYLTDNTDTDSFRGIQMIAVFQDEYPFFSSMMEDVIHFELGKGVKYFTSDDIGVVDLSGYDRVVIASTQSASFRLDVSNNAEWFESYADHGGILEIHAATEQGRYLSLPGGVGMVGDVTYNQIEIEDPSSDLFRSPNTISSQDLSNWYWSALGHLTGLNPLTKVYASEGETANSNPVLAAQAQGNGYIIYTTLGVEARWASYPFLVNLLQFVPTDVPKEGVRPVIIGNEKVVMYNDQYETLIYIIESEFHDTYKISINGAETVYNWDNPTETVTIDTTGWSVGNHTVRIEATDVIGQSTILETTVEVLQGKSFSSSSTSNNGPFNVWMVLASFGMLAFIPILKRNGRKP